MGTTQTTVYKTRLTKKQEIAVDTMAFYFEKPAGFTYKAGQYGDLTFEHPPETDAEGNTRGFSFASAPYEEELMMATRMRDTAFKRVLKNMQLGAEIKLEASWGSFTLHNNNSTPAVFITGGIGITPVRSIVMQTAQDGLQRKILVFYANKTEPEAAFLDELTEAQKRESNYKLIPIMTRSNGEAEAWEGETAHVSGVMLEKYIEDLALPIYYISGPPAMVKESRKMLNDSGVNDDNIRSEEFVGY
jgi:ferredoxin-NADP reductase